MKLHEVVSLTLTPALVAAAVAAIPPAASASQLQSPPLASQASYSAPTPSAAAADALPADAINTSVAARIEPTAPIADDIASDTETGVTTLLPTSDDTSTVTLQDDLAVSLAVPGSRVSEDNTSVPTLTDDDHTIVTNPTADGVQVVWTIPNAASTHALEIKTQTPSGSAWTVTKDRSLVLRDSSATTSTDPIMGSSAPWAYDATGRSLPTSFHVQGSSIIQDVDTTGAVYPITADPSLRWWGSVAVCAAEIAIALTPTGAVAKLANSARVAKIINSSTALRNAVKTLGGVKNAFVLARASLQGKRYGAAVERALKVFMDQGKSALFGALGIGGCYDAYTELRR